MIGSETSRVALLRAIFDSASEGTLVGIGDDAAVLAGGAKSLVWTVDAAVEGVHFLRRWMSLEDVGYRATMAALSDIAAMGGTVVGVLSALILPADFSDEDLLALARGQRRAADDARTTIAGGNLARGRELSITTTALGRTSEPMLRSGARPGDALWIAGGVGLAAAGRLRRDRDLLPVRREELVADDAFRRPLARLAEGLLAAPLAHAAIDVSDGLARDVAHIAEASDVRVVLDPATLVSPELAHVALSIDADPLELALHGGEDYALVVAAPPGAKLQGFRCIGGCEARGTDAHRVTLVGADGQQTPVEPRGFDHFAVSDIQREAKRP